MGVQGLSVDIGNSIEEVINDAAKAIVASTEELDLSSSDFNVATETVDLDATEATTDIDLSNVDMSSLTPEELEALVGTMTQEEYNQFIEGMEGYYDNQLEYLEGLLHTDDQTGYEDVLAYVDQYVNLYMEGSIITEEQERVYLDRLAEFGVTDITSALALQSEYKGYVDQINQGIMMTKNVRDSAKYDYMYFMADYADYKMNETEDLKATLEADSNAVVYNDYVADPNSLALGPIDPNAGYKVYSYQAYHEKHPDIDPMEYVMMLPEDAVVWDIEGYETLKTLAYVYEMNPEYARVYSYLYSQDPEKAKDYLKANEYEFNSLQGQIEALAVSERLYGADEATVEEILSNELGISAEGLKDGVITFGEGVWHAGEAVVTGSQEFATAMGWYDGEIYENRVMSVNEYKKMYLLQMLLSEEDKIKAGVLTETGENANPNSLIDFTKEYAGGCLSNNYEISQGIGNMLPSIAISMVNPMAGSVALGVSSGGNAYHTSMVQGNDYLTSLGYGIFTGTTEAATQRLLGGIPGLSDVQVTGLKTYLQSMAREGGQEMLQGVLDEVYQAAFMGKELPTTAEEWAEFAQNIGKQGLYGAITAGVLQVPSLASSRHRISTYQNYMKNNQISSEEQSEIIDAIRKSNPDLSKVSDDEILLNNYQQIVNIVKIKNNNNLDVATAISVYNIMNENTISEARAVIVQKLMSENDLDTTSSLTISNLMLENNLDSETAIRVDSLMTENNLDVATAIIVNNLMIENNLDTSTAITIQQLMAEQNIDAETAISVNNIMIENSLDVETAIAIEGIMSENNLDIAAALTVYNLMTENNIDAATAITVRDLMSDNIIDAATALTVYNLMTENNIDAATAINVNSIMSVNDCSASTAIIINNLNQTEELDAKLELLNPLSGEEIVEVCRVLNNTDPKQLNSLLVNVDSQFMITLTQELLKPTMEYYTEAAKMVADEPLVYKNFLTYRTHCEGHVDEVAKKSMESATAIQEALSAHQMNGFSNEVNLYELYISAIWHDTGMAAGAAGVPGLDSTLDSNNNIETKILKENQNGDLTRSNHSFNSAINVLINADTISEYGVDPNIISLLCFSHSKSNSGISILNKASDWSLCISKIDNAVQFYNSQNPNNPIVFANGDPTFVDSLVTSGILNSTASEPASTTNKKGETVNYTNYTDINMDVLSRIASEAFALRLGDANTNNNNLGTNQAGNKIDINSIVGEWNNSFEVQDETFDNIKALVVSEAFGIDLTEAKRRMNLPKDDPEYINFFGTDTTGISIEIGGKRISLSSGQLAFIKGEANVDFNTSTNDNGILVEQFTILDPTQVPASTLFAIDERLGELNTAKNGGYVAEIEIHLKNVDITDAEKAEIKKYYEAFAEQSGYKAKVDWV